MKPLNWATLGCGVIANELATALARQNRHLYSVANRTHEKAVAFAEKYQIAKVYDHLEDVFTDPDVDIIYISTPHNTHIQYLRQALANGKHVLCEKSITLNSNELDEAIALAEKNHVILAEAMTIFHMPIYRKLAEIISSGTLGPLRLVQVNFGSYKEYDMNNRFFNMNLAGCALLDIGVYALSLMRSFMAETPDQVMSQVRFAPTGTDEQASIILMNKEQQMAAITLSMHSKQPKRAMISCEKGYIEIMEYPRADKAIIVDAASGAVTPVEAGETKRALEYEMRDMEEAVQSGDVSRMQMPFTRDVMNIMTDLRKNWGLVYPEESGKTE